MFAGLELKYLFYIFTYLTSNSSLDSIASFDIINMKLNNCVRKQSWHNLSKNMEIIQKTLNENKVDIRTSWMLLKILKVRHFYGTVRIFKSECHSKTMAFKLYCSLHTFGSQNT